MMSYLDGELDEEARREFEAKIARHPELAREVEKYRRLQEITDAVRFEEPSDVEWREFWNGFYNRCERRGGWLLVAIGAVLVSAYAIYDVLVDPGIAILLRAGILALVLGFLALFLSVFRGWLRVRKFDRYRRIRR
jgi:anti-sigma factor RsiW